jgi:hypothetical protein
LKENVLPSVKSTPLPSLTGVKSIRSDPGTASASYHVATLDVPSAATVVVFWTNVAVLYQEPPYCRCIEAMRSVADVIAR